MCDGIARSEGSRGGNANVLPDFQTLLSTSCVRARRWIILIMQCVWVYILTNSRHTVLYVGVTNNIATRLWEHQTKQNPSCFTARYNIQKLIYYEGLDSIVEAIAREKIIKGKSRKWKAELIQKMNPEWNDLAAVAKYL
jgi:putative endonuclease